MRSHGGRSTLVGGSGHGREQVQMPELVVRSGPLQCCINPDAHATGHFDYQLAGVQTARKGWLTAENVLNTRTLKEVIDYLDLSG